MSDFDQDGTPLGASGSLDGPRAWGHIMYGLHAAAVVFGLLTSATIVGAFVFSTPSIIAVVINYLTRGSVRGTWLDSHWAWQLRTFWFALLWGLVALLFAVTIIGVVVAIPVLAVAGLWVLYRIIRGWHALANGKAVPGAAPV